VRSPSDQLSAPLVLLFAFGTAVSVATLYLNQPLLHLLGRDLQANERTIGLLVTFTQLGYAAGIFSLVPLGDTLNKKKLILGKLAVLLVALLAAGMAQNVFQLVLASLAIGVFSTAAQDFLPLAAELAEPQRRGQVVGTVMGGLLLGILVSRTFSGVIADHLGWRAVFLISAGIIGFLAVLVLLRVPSRPKTMAATYPELIRSLGTLLRRYPVLRLAIATQGFMGVAFSAFWTVLAFHLSRPPFQFSTASIGYFGLAGAAGALAAPLAGKRADRKGPAANIPTAIAITAAAFLLMGALQRSLPALIVGTVLFDLGVQMSGVSHQAIVYALEPEARSRINALYVSGIFLFFALGSLAGTTLFNHFGWTGMVGLCLGSCVVAYLLHRRLLQRRRESGAPNRSSRVDAPPLR